MFKDGKICGRVEKYVNDQLIYYGNFENDAMNGKGNLKNLKPKQIQQIDDKKNLSEYVADCWYEYDGEFVNNKR